MQEVDCKVLEYRVDQVEKQNDKMVETVNSVADKVSTIYTDQELIKQRIGWFTVIVGVVCNAAFALILHFNPPSTDTPRYTEDDKRMYYDSRVQESEVVKQLREEIERLKAR